MTIKPIHTETEYNESLKKIESLIELDPELGTIEADQLEVLSILVESYEDKHYRIEEPDPIEAILFRMEQSGLSRKDLKPYIGDSGRIAEIMGRKRNLSINMIRKLHHHLKIPYESLMKETKLQLT